MQAWRGQRPGKACPRLLGPWGRQGGQRRACSCFRPEGPPVFSEMGAWLHLGRPRDRGQWAGAPVPSEVTQGCFVCPLLGKARSLGPGQGGGGVGPWAAAPPWGTRTNHHPQASPHHPLPREPACPGTAGY